MHGCHTDTVGMNSLLKVNVPFWQLDPIHLDPNQLQKLFGIYLAYFVFSLDRPLKQLGSGLGRCFCYVELQQYSIMLL